MKFLVAAVLGITLAPGVASSQVANSCKPSVASLRQIAGRVWSETHDGNRVVSAIDREFGVTATDLLRPISLDNWDHEGLTFTLNFPGRMYRDLLVEALRKRDPIESLTVPDVVVINVGVD